MNQVRIYVQDFDKRGDREGYHFFTSDWDLPRKHVYTYLTDAKGQEAAEEAYHIFNAPESMLKEWQKFIAKNYSGPSLSVGDLVEVDGKDYLCCSVGWKSRTDNPIDWEHIEKQARRKAFTSQEDCLPMP